MEKFKKKNEILEEYYKNKELKKIKNEQKQKSYLKNSQKKNVYSNKDLFSNTDLVYKELLENLEENESFQKSSRNMILTKNRWLESVLKKFFKEKIEISTKGSFVNYLHMPYSNFNHNVYNTYFSSEEEYFFEVNKFYEEFQKKENLVISFVLKKEKMVIIKFRFKEENTFYFDLTFRYKKNTDLLSNEDITRSYLKHYQISRII